MTLASGKEISIKDNASELKTLIEGIATDIKPERFDTSGKVRLAELEGIDDRVADRECRNLNIIIEKIAT